MLSTRKLAAATALATGLIAGTASAQSDCGEVSITEMNWASSVVVTAVSEFLMEQGYGCDVTKIPSSTKHAQDILKGDYSAAAVANLGCAITTTTVLYPTTRLPHKHIAC